MTSNEQPLPESLGAQLLDTYYRTLDEALAAMPPARERRLEEIGYVLPRPSARLLLPARERPRAD
jgi:hypothetical protein